jgi:16S rRNA C967 or C1407 C5-methylase (RsmB/RsmF family)
VQRFLAEHPEFAAESLSPGADTPFRHLLPHVDHTDGFFIARLRRE